jgi:hypothetical protein
MRHGETGGEEITERERAREREDAFAERQLVTAIKRSHMYYIDSRCKRVVDAATPEQQEEAAEGGQQKGEAGMPPPSPGDALTSQGNGGRVSPRRASDSGPSGSSAPQARHNFSR